jgi:UDP-N-acetylglucosamine--N-acetylmuramyl-(pentapeptide) pyrophosphoryl-undecaprenol N-acetylglucosamine transferase
MPVDANKKNTNIDPVETDSIAGQSREYKQYPGKKVLMMAGGTGGHVIPALSLAKDFQSKGLSVEWLGSPQGIENRLVPEANITLHHIDVVGLRGKGLVRKLLAPWLILKAVLQAKTILQAYRPDFVVGLGGFASGPGGLAAKLLGIPLFIHEQNAVAGMTNRWLSKFARTTFAAFPDAFKQIKAVVTGNPVRDSLFGISDKEQVESPFKLLVVGGSLGAQAINECLPNALAKMPVELQPQVRHQSGRGKLESTCHSYQQAGTKADVIEFIDDMHSAFEWADIVLCRAGALTVSELAAAGRASILVPLPIAVDDHQTANARFLVNEEAGILLPQKEMDQTSLAQLLTELANAPEKIKQMGNNARRAARPQATREVVDQCLETRFG